MRTISGSQTMTGPGMQFATPVATSMNTSVTAKSPSLAVESTEMLTFADAK
jgi:hypothetical protein